MIKGAIVESFPFRGVLFARGEISCDQAPQPHTVPKIEAVLLDGTVIPARVFQDPQHPGDASVFKFQLHASLPRPLNDDEHEKLAYRVEWGGEVGELRDFLGPKYLQDPFLRGGETYWSAVKQSSRPRVLEIGSRARSGITRRHLFPEDADYTGFDILPGENVTMVGDAHSMSQVLPNDYYDFAFSVSVWEHLCMPWVVSLELNRVLKTGGLAMINTHQAWPFHEGPWDFFRFADSSWDALFNEATGFEIVEKAMGQPCAMVPNLFYRGMSLSGIDWQEGYLAARCVVRKIGSSSLAWPVPASMVQKGLYPH